jgi:hypothetical protein
MSQVPINHAPRGKIISYWDIIHSSAPALEPVKLLAKLPHTCPYCTELGCFDATAFGSKANLETVIERGGLSHHRQLINDERATPEIDAKTAHIFDLCCVAFGVGFWP